MVTDPVYVKELEQDFHEESLKVMDKDWWEELFTFIVSRYLSYILKRSITNN